MQFLRSLLRPTQSVPPDDFEDSDSMPPSNATRLLIGLGNPGRQYANTRHNAGFFVIDELARRWNAPTSKPRFRGEISEVRRGEVRCVLVMPQTYMNESGLTVREAVQWYKTPLDQVLVVVDDLDLPFGEVRLRARGSAGGHNGLKSVFQLLGTQEISRLKVGIGRPRSATISHVLSLFAPEEEAQLATVVGYAADVAERWLERGVIETMNVANDPANQPLAKTP